jgi:electron transfer flavoprotein beta subunit
MGPPQATAVLKEALAMGCDEAYLLSDRAFGGADSLATGYVLAKAAEKIGGYDLLLFGKCAVDAETAQTGPITAELLDLPQVTLVDELACADGWATCRRDLGNQFQTVKVKLPALIAVTGQINRPRYPRPARIRIINSLPLTVWSAADLSCDPERIGTVGSPSCTRKVYAPEKRGRDTRYLSGTPDEIARAIADILEAEHIL